MFTSSSETVSSPGILSASRGSSVTTGLREEYEDLLRYAVVTPVLNTDVGEFPLIATTKSCGPPPRISPPPKPYTPPQYITRAEMKAKVSKVESDDIHSELSGAPPPSSVTAQLSSATIPPPKFLPLQTENLERSSTESHDYEDDDSHLLVNNPEVAQLETKMEAWCLDLKRNVLVEFEQDEILMRERHQAELMKERQRHAHEIEQLREELKCYKELMVTYEQSVARKDDIISNLTKALQKQKDHVELQRTFNSWKLCHVNDKWELFTSTLAKRHHHHKLMSRVCAAWFALVQGRWKQRVEKACQSKAEEVCVQLTGQYEEQVANIQQSLDNCQQEVARLKVERNLYEENMKKAFMRGVCALNLEAMTMFQNHVSDSDDKQHNHAGTGGDHYVSSSSHIHGGSETGLEPLSSHLQPGVPATQLKSQAGSGSKCVLVTTSTAIPPSSQSGNMIISRHAQTSSNSCKKPIKLVPAVTVEKH